MRGPWVRDSGLQLIRDLMYLLGSLHGTTGSCTTGLHLICLKTSGNWHYSWHVKGAQLETN